MTDIVSGHGKAEYDLYAHEELPRTVDHDLEMWGCVACNFCVTVCPNDAFFRLPTPGGADLTGRQQYLVFAELCNECGNCMVVLSRERRPRPGEGTVVPRRRQVRRRRRSGFPGATRPRRSDGHGASGFRVAGPCPARTC